MPGTDYVTADNLERKAREWKQRLGAVAEHSLTTLEKPALLVIDMQRYFVHPEAKAYLPAARAVLPNVQRLITQFSAKGFPAIFTRHGHRRETDAGMMQSWWKGRLLYEDDADAELVLETGSDAIVRKESYDAFRNTELDGILKEHAIRDVVICGVMTDLCVETTARQSFMNGYQPVVAIDATATKTELLHLAALSTLAHGFAYTETIDTILEMMK